MGFFDKVKGQIKNAVQQGQQPQAQAQPESQPQAHYHQAEPEPDVEEAAEPNFDLAGFDVLNDEESFFNAVLHMESEGQFGGTDESRAEICARFGIRDRSHWHVVKESNYTMLVRKHGSGNEVSQRELNWRQGQMQRAMMGNVAQMQKQGGFEPVEGISLEMWAAMNASIVSGANADDLLRGQGIDRARWERVSAEWNARMARDTTFAIAQIYGNAFQAASQGKYGAYAREANAARTANRDLSMELPMAYEQFYEMMLEQKYAAKQGKDPVATLKGQGLSVVDWTDLSAFMGYYFNRTAQRFWPQYQEIHQRLDAKWAAANPGVDVDIQF